MEEIFDSWCCRSCDRYSLAQEKTQEAACYSAKNKQVRQNDQKQLISSTAGTASKGSMTAKMSLSPQRISSLIKEKASRKAALKSNSVKPSQFLNSLQPHISQSVVLENPHNERPPCHEMLHCISNRPFSHKLHTGDQTLQAKKERPPYLKVNTESNEKNNRYMEPPTINFEYRSLEKVNPRPQSYNFKKIHQKICISPVVQLTTQEPTLTHQEQVQELESEQLKERIVKFNEVKEVNVYTQKSLGFYSENRSFSRQEGQISNQAINYPSIKYFRRNDSQVSNTYTQVHEDVISQTKENPHIHHLNDFKPTPRRQKKTFTTFVPFQQLKKNRMRTVMTIKSIDAESEGSILDFNFMQNFAETRQIKKLM